MLERDEKGEEPHPWLSPDKARAVAPIFALNGESLTLPQNIFPFHGS